ncbi:response regulator transcription factor [Adlercreutzia sp. R25]|uniref:Response regulator transcription factor n=1 Tax=Adlercreutzia shanghongiae TaxID=3111773 RepID=A0ABU6IZ61_9ACTN|nr:MULTISPECIES: response regulator transcription factor [unclassified Adlercreutzia]MEC4273051.1 response regulator transcription factor [Adlercreutzia sp. R25]MEC4295159.1 response regulator transcription factor [Adlercreutzia sp. R22]
MTKILLADDEENLREAVTIILEKAGYAVCAAADGTQAVEAFLSERPDLVILDVMMPWMSGYEVCERIREVSEDVPVLMLSAKGDIIDKKSGFHAGADDYVVKPFNDEELLLRVEALLRRRGHKGATPSAVGQVVTVGSMVIDPRRCEVTVGERSVSLTPKEFQILALMAESPGKVFTREDLIEMVWGDEYDTGSVSIPVYIRRIREKVEEDPSNPVFIQTIWGFGYRLGGE